MKTNNSQIFAQGMCFDKIVWIFLSACVVGFTVETLWCFLRHGYIESRKSLVYGPLSVAYGMGALVAFLVGTVTEYICSLGQEICFGSVAWDYSNLPFNINGRVCLLYSLFWGALGLGWIKVIYPFMSNLIEKIPYSLGTVLTWAFVAFFIFDCALSAAAAVRMDKRNAGVPATNFVESYLDVHFDDERMHKIYANSNEVKKS